MSKNDTVSLEDLETEVSNPAETSAETSESTYTGSDWFSVGDEGYEKKKKQDEEFKAKQEIRQDRYTPRYWMPKDTEKVVIFVDDPVFYLWEHNKEINGRWGNYMTCIKDHGACMPCADNLSAVYTCYGTVIDCTGYTSKKTKERVKNIKSLFPAKSDTIDKIKKLVKKHGSLKGLAFKITRYKNDPNCGSDFELIGDGKRVDIATSLGEEYATPFDYRKILAPPTKDELKGWGIGSVVMGSDADITKDEVEELESLL